MAVRGCEVEWNGTGQTDNWSGGVTVSVGVAPGKPDERDGNGLVAMFEQTMGMPRNDIQ